jgi:hypothetical protein
LIDGRQIIEAALHNLETNSTRGMSVLKEQESLPVELESHNLHNDHAYHKESLGML